MAAKFRGAYIQDERAPGGPRQFDKRTGQWDALGDKTSGCIPGRQRGRCSCIVIQRRGGLLMMARVDAVGVAWAVWKGASVRGVP